MTLINVPSFAPINQKGTGFRTQKENNFVEICFCKRSKITVILRWVAGYPNLTSVPRIQFLKGSFFMRVGI